MSVQACIVCHHQQEGERLFCSHCGGLTQGGASHFQHFNVCWLIARWEGGALYQATPTHTPHDLEEEQEKEQESVCAWVFIYEEELVHAPTFAKIQHEDRLLARVPHPHIATLIDRGMIGRRPYSAFAGHTEAMALPHWRPSLPAHVRSHLFSRLAELAIMMQSASIRRPVLDPYRLMLFWDKQEDMLDFRWLPLPEVGQFLSHEHPQEKGAPTQTDPLAERFPLQRSPHHPASSSLLPPPPGPLPESSTDVLSMMPQEQRRAYTAGGKSLTQTDEFELMAVLDRLGDSNDDLVSLAKRLADLEKATRVDDQPETAEGSRESSEKTDPGRLAVSEKELAQETITDDEDETDPPRETPASKPDPMTTLQEEPPARLDSSPPGYAEFDFSELSVSPDEHTLTPMRLKRKTNQGTEGFGKAPHTPPPMFVRQNSSFLAPDDHPTPESDKQTAPQPARKLAPPKPDDISPSAKEPKPLQKPSKKPTSQKSELLQTMTELRLPAEHVPLRKLHITTRHYTKMTRGQLFPLELTIEEEVPLGAQGSFVTISPILPGCIISPTSESVELVEGRANVTFWVTPMVAADLRRSAQLSLCCQGTQTQTLSLPTQVHQITPVYGLMLLSIVGLGLGAWQQMLPVWASGAGLFVLSVLLYFFWARPKQPPAAEHTLSFPTQRQGT